MQTRAHDIHTLFLSTALTRSLFGMSPGTTEQCAIVELWTQRNVMGVTASWIETFVPVAARRQVRKNATLVLEV
jgi:hypothetical protein